MVVLNNEARSLLIISAIKDLAETHVREHPEAVIHFAAVVSNWQVAQGVRTDYRTNKALYPTCVSEVDAFLEIMMAITRANSALSVARDIAVHIDEDEKVVVPPRPRQGATHAFVVLANGGVITLHAKLRIPAPFFANGSIVCLDNLTEFVPSESVVEGVVRVNPGGFRSYFANKGPMTLGELPEAHLMRFLQNVGLSVSGSTRQSLNDRMLKIDQSTKLGAATGAGLETAVYASAKAGAAKTGLIKIATGAVAKGATAMGAKAAVVAKIGSICIPIVGAVVICAATGVVVGKVVAQTIDGNKTYFICVQGDGKLVDINLSLAQVDALAQSHPQLRIGVAAIINAI